MLPDPRRPIITILVIIARLALLCSAVFALTSFAQARALWHGTHYGMTFEEVRKMFPESKDSSFVVNGHKFQVVTDSTTIDDYHFAVNFMFKAGVGLDRIDLTCTDKLMNAKGAAVGRHFLELLEAKYGKGKASEDGNTNDPDDIEVVWITAEKVQITLSYFAELKSRDGTHKLAILYDGSRLKGASEL